MQSINLTTALVLAVVLSACRANEALDALEKDDPKKALALLEKNPKLIDLPGRKQCTPLHHVARFKNIELVKWLIEHKANVNAIAYNGFTPLHLTTDKEVAALLIKAGADLTIKDNWHNTPLEMATLQKEQSAGMIEAVIESGFALDLKSALLLEKRDLVKKMVQDNPKLVQPTGQESDLHINVTPLGIAAVQGDNEIVQLFLKLGAPIDAGTTRPGAGSITPLQNAVMARKEETVELLCKAGADCNTMGGKFVKGHYDFLLDYAEANSTEKIAAILRKYGAKKNASKPDGK